MPFPSLPPVSVNAPTCARSFLYQIGNLYYYETVDCATGATGYGTWGQNLGDEHNCCVDGQCVEGRTIVPTVAIPVPFAPAAVTEKVNRSAKDPGKKKLKVGKTKRSRKLALDAINDFKGRRSTSGDRDNISLRRKNLAEYLLQIPAGSTVSNLELILDSHPDIRDVLLNLIGDEFAVVREEDEGTLTRDAFCLPDRNLDVVPIPSTGAFTSNVLPGTVISPFMTTSTSDLVRLKRKAGPDTVIFRLQKVQVSATITHFVGQSVDDLPTGSPAPPLGKWLDRHSHFHLIEATDNGGATQRFVVYSAEDLAEHPIVS